VNTCGYYIVTVSSLGEVKERALFLI